MASIRLARPAHLTLAAVALSVGLVGCSSEAADQPAPASSAAAATSKAAEEAGETSAPESTTAPSEGEASETTEESESAESTESSAAAESSESAQASESTAATTTSKRDDSIDEAHEIFAPVAGKGMFDQFDRCDPVGVKDSFNCSGPEIGQIQFFKSKSKASQTTQVLTELRSSRVVEDTGDRVVGWSTLGTTAVLTVVDNKEGLVLQQMISTDQEDPEAKLKELGLLP